MLWNAGQVAETWICQALALVKVLFQSKSIGIFLISPRKHMLSYSLSASQGAFNEYPQHMFLWRNKKNINLILTLI